MSGFDLPVRFNPGLLGTVCAAVSTPPGPGALAVIRLSGAGSPAAADLIFRPFGTSYPSVSAMPGYTCAFGEIIDPADQALIDQVVLTRFTAPHSYTGEEVVEISCHGGTAVKQAILDCLFRFGVQPAEAGEFTRRAFLNGKLDLVQAEAVMDLIQAAARKSSRAAAAQLQGRLSHDIRQIAEAVYGLLAQAELILEYPEHEETGAAMSGLAAQLDDLRQQLRELAGSYRQGRLLREGLTVVIAGRPNAGKSSLLNALAGYDRAIVTPVPGTTRDTVEELVDIGGLPVRLIDTAGLRETVDLIEKMGVDRAREALRNADLVFWLVAPPLEALDAEAEEIKMAAGQPMVVVAGKEDLTDSQPLRKKLQDLLPGYPIVPFSALTGEGLDSLRQVIQDHYRQAGSSGSDEVVVTNSRHKACLDQALEYLDQAAAALASGIPLDLAASLLRGCAEALAGITGDSVSEELIRTIFSRFCIGK
ncbi:MAG TPA: tRNA uridine-5-carboxymethylaminomethyl(34) synthesis GTPase MnmE [Clostridiales bacterium]|nr:tRNA uridine-5-carboxymethylaminomethyl(34) synthesis GTPase MnmE [Clostridiales bacterium]